MGDIADMMLDGTLCEGCGVFLDCDNDCHVPRKCRACAEDDRFLDIPDFARKSQATVNCPTCQRRVKEIGLADHMRDKHGNQQ